MIAVAKNRLGDTTPATHFLKNDRGDKMTGDEKHNNS